MVCLRHGYINIYGNRFINVTKYPLATLRAALSPLGEGRFNFAFCILHFALKTRPFN